MLLIWTTCSTAELVSTASVLKSQTVDDINMEHNEVQPSYTFQNWHSSTIWHLSQSCAPSRDRRTKLFLFSLTPCYLGVLWVKSC